MTAVETFNSPNIKFYATKVLENCAKYSDGVLINGIFIHIEPREIALIQTIEHMVKNAHIST